MIKKRVKQWISLLLAMVMLAGMVAFQPSALAVDGDPASVEYELYPIPQSITYEDSTMALPDAMNVFYGNSIDQYTKARAVEAFQEVGVTLTETSADQASVLIGVASDNDAALSGIGVGVDNEVFGKIDGYCLKIAGDKIYVVGRHTDAAFYGLTTLLQLFQQVDDNTRQVRQLDIKDWADVASRGFIEGYYGNPWSVEDRSELMRWGGYYKLNSYFYAPKDDPKHNAQWRVLYTDEELQNLIAPLAKAGNESKCQFVFALHPFMNSPINSGNYAASLETLKKKFEQTMEYGVRQIAVLADDAGVPGGDNATGWQLQTQLMKDLVDWVSSPEMQQKYPGLKTTIPFCPNAYMYGSGNAQLKYFGQNMPETVPLVVTGGKVWGEVSQNFTQNFTNWVGRGPYLWINWPCSDNSKRHLIMGGYTNFLQVGVQPQNIQGITVDAQTAQEGELVQVKAEPKTGYALKENGIKVYKTSDPETTIPVEQNDTFRMPPYDVTVMAQFEAIRYQITYQMDGGINTDGNPGSYTVEDRLTLQNPTRDGFVFAGWTYEGMDTPATDLIIPAGAVSGNLSLTAHWRDNTVQAFTVTFQSNGGSTVPSQTVPEGNLAVEPNAPTKADYRFDGWYTDASLTTAYQFNTPITSDLMLYAKWTYVGGLSSGGSSSSSSSGNTTETTHNPNGSTTTTVTHPDGSTIETTKYLDGSQEVVETEKNGVVTTTTTDADGNKTEVVQKTDGSSQTTMNNEDGSRSVTVVDHSGSMSSTAYLSRQAIRAAEQSGSAVTVPIPEIPVTTDQENAPTVTVSMASGNSVTVEIPVANATAGTVAVLVKADGSEEIIKDSLTTEKGVTAKLSDGDTVKILDNSTHFVDVPTSHWSADAVAFATSRELFSGTSKNTFSPEVAMTRAMIVTVLARYEGVDTSTGDDWYDAGRQWAMANGVSDGSNMDARLSREQLATMLYRYAGEPTVSGSLSGFTDASSVSSYAQTAMAWAVENGLITGITDTTLVPQGQATRAQVAAILQRYVQFVA